MGTRDDDNNTTPSNDNEQELDDMPSAASAEHVERYLRLHEHIERLREDRRPNNPGKLPPDEASAYKAAALFRSATPGAAEPDPAFVNRLRDQLEREVHTSAPLRAVRSVRRGLSRRGLLASGLGVAAAAAAGFGVATFVEQAAQPSSTAKWDTALVPQGTGTWLAVATLDQLPVGAVRRFATENMVGYVRHTAAGFSALSGACTHMGCLLNWNGAARTFDCPCHGGRFTEDGVAASSSVVAYRPLPHIQTKVEAGQVWVYVSTATGQAVDTPTDSPTSNDLGGYGR